MTWLQFWQVDAFTKEPFKGNAAAVFILEEPLSDALMQSIANELNLAETAFVLIRDGKNPLLRWFTPLFEIDLCGHATLASSHIYMTKLDPHCTRVDFDTKFVGTLGVEKVDQGYQMNFPLRPGEKQEINHIPEFVLAALTRNSRPSVAYQSRDLMLIYDNEQIIYDMTPDFKALEQYEGDIIVSAQSADPQYDFIARFFCARETIPEDPLTGSAYCTLAPYWSACLAKSDLRAYQASKRGGSLRLKLIQDRVLIEGEAITVTEAKMNVEGPL